MDTTSVDQAYADWKAALTETSGSAASRKTASDALAAAQAIDNAAAEDLAAKQSNLANKRDAFKAAIDAVSIPLAAMGKMPH